MGIILQQAFNIVQSFSTAEVTLNLGIIAAFVHHFTCQFPQQVDVLTTLYAWVIGNCFLLVALFICDQEHILSNFCVGLLSFNFAYVSTFEMYC